MPDLRFLPLLMLVLMLSSASAAAADSDLVLVIQDHRFEPSELVVPAGQRLKLLIHNRDETPEEFESYSLNREKVVAGGATIVLYVGPLKPGVYEFFGEFHADTATGRLIAE